MLINNKSKGFLFSDIFVKEPIPEKTQEQDKCLNSKLFYKSKTDSTIEL